MYVALFFRHLCQGPGYTVITQYWLNYNFKQTFCFVSVDLFISEYCLQRGVSFSSKKDSNANIAATLKFRKLSGLLVGFN